MLFASRKFKNAQPQHGLRENPMDRKTLNVSPARRPKETMKSIFNARTLVVSVCIYNQPFLIYFTDYQYSAGFHGLSGLFNPWLDAPYFGPWHLPHPALVKGKISQCYFAFERERGKRIEREKYFTLFCVS